MAEESLFGLFSGADPFTARRQARQRVVDQFAATPNFQAGTLFSNNAAQAGAGIGQGIARLFGREPPEVQRARTIQQVQQEVSEKGLTPKSPEFFDFTAQRFVDAGLPDLALRTRQLQLAFQGTEAKTASDLSTAAKNRLDAAGVSGPMVTLFKDGERKTVRRDSREAQQLIDSGFIEEQSSDRTRRNLIESGVPPKFAAGLAAGRYTTSRDPQTGVATVVDKSTGRTIGQYRPKQEPPESGTSFIPDSTDVSEATGFGGIMRNAVNVIGDAFGMGQAFPETDRAANALQDMQVLTQSFLQAEVPGRPSNFLLERLQKLTVTPNSLLQGEERARNRLRQTRDLLDTEINRIDNEVLTLPLRPATEQKTRINRTQLANLRDAYDTALESFNRSNKESPLLELDDRELEARVTEMSPEELNKLDRETLQQIRQRLGGQ